MKAIRNCCLLVTLLAVVIDINSASPVQPKLEDEDANLTVPEIIAKYGYPIELHEVITEDGYILTLHRIPYGKTEGSGPGPNKPVVWLQHGLLGDSSNWIMNTEEKALAYVLANRGYDVWLGNARGNTYSRRHVTLDANKEPFWKFSWEEMGKYDVPVVLDYILTTSGQPDLYYFGHSMGTTMFWVAMSTYPELNSKIKLMSAFAPIAYLEHMPSPFSALAPFSNQIEWVLANLGASEFLPSNFIMDLLGATICQENSPIQALCSNVLFLMAGYDAAQLNTTALPVIMGHTPAGASVRCLVHYGQLVNSALFRKYNYGKAENLIVYGQETPPEYDISKITAPVALYWGENDWMGAPSDVYRLAEQLPNMVRKYRINFDKYNHLDFLWAIDNDKLLHNQAVEFMELF